MTEFAQTEKMAVSATGPAIELPRTVPIAGVVRGIRILLSWTPPPSEIRTHSDSFAIVLAAPIRVQMGPIRISLGIGASDYWPHSTQSKH